MCECECTSVYLPRQDLHAAGEAKFGTDEETFIKIIGNRSTEHLRKGDFHDSLFALAYLYVLIGLSPAEVTSKVAN